jgi:hypothetical protein
LEIFSSAASFDMSEPGPAKIAPAEAGRVSAAGDLRRDATGFATCCGVCGLATCFGASTVMLGSVELGVVCDIAVPVRPNSNMADMRATVEGETMLDDILMTRSPIRT